eukprot:gnl/TRDRNA2_/TRDRNA2_158250_c0_seq3.p1 gnl/TRDRNA2_/TRDRNA2_158250_c0~~gnl/TRDRNA2_/TRDRNA2_158250_c0_seq3.p1  ORF type:complete len:173 (+),score=30.50 gnl/TRDRNA2_/TRDRNA2_158250_c0_seq3:55-519(+)
MAKLANKEVKTDEGEASEAKDTASNHSCTDPAGADMATSKVEVTTCEDAAEAVEQADVDDKKQRRHLKVNSHVAYTGPLEDWFGRDADDAAYAAASRIALRMGAEEYQEDWTSSILNLFIGGDESFRRLKEDPTKFTFVISEDPTLSTCSTATP